MFWKNFKTLCDTIKKSPNTVALEIGCSSGSVTAWKQGRVPKWQTLQKIADYFNVSVEDLLKEEKPADEGELSEDVIIFHRDGKTVKKQFTKEQMDMLMTMIDAIPEKPKNI